MVRVRKAVIPAAGLGTRFLPATKTLPKEMIPIIDKPIIQYVVEEAVESGIQDIIIVTARGKSAIEDYFDRSPELETVLERSCRSEQLNWIRAVSKMVDLHFIRQKDPLGLGHAVYQARRHIGNEPFAVLLADEIFWGDEPCLAEVLRCFDATGKSVVAVREVQVEDTQRYGMVKTEPIGNGLYLATGMVEKPEPSEAPSRLAMVGRYVLSPAIFDVLENLKPGKNGEIQLTDALNLLLHEEPVYAWEVRSLRFDAGDPFGYIQATLHFALQRPDLSAWLQSYLRTLIMESELSGR